MKHLHTFILFFIIAFAVGFFLFPRSTNAPSQGDSLSMQEEQMAMNKVKVIPIQHASFVLEWGGKTLYADPAEGNYMERPIADIVFMTDIHPDHFKPEVLALVAGSDTVIIAPQAVADEMSEAVAGNVRVLTNGEKITVGEFEIEAIPMYNLPENETAYHVKGRGNGYVISREDKRVYIAGDTGPIDEMKALKNIDIAFIPMNLPYTMTVEEAAEAVLAFSPGRVYPYHYRGTEGLSDVNLFVDLIQEGSSDIDTVQAEWYPES